MLTSPDGNWIALQSAQLSRPSLLAKRKSLVYSALERESAVVSAYEDMGSDNETRHEADGCWGAGLQEIQRKKIMDSYLNQQVDDKTPSSAMGQGSRHDPIKDPEGNWESRKPLLALLKRSMSADTKMTSLSSKCNTVDVNYKVEGAEEEGERRSQKESAPSELVRNVCSSVILVLKRNPGALVKLGQASGTKTLFQKAKTANANFYSAYENKFFFNSTFQYFDRNVVKMAATHNPPPAL